MLCDILSDHHERCYHHFRMSATTFIALRDALVERGLISSTRNMTADEQLGIFLYGVGHGVANRILAETIQHSGETISRHFNNVLRGIVRLKDDYIMLSSSNAAVHPRIQNNPNFHPFKNAIGAIDGTHIPVVVERSKQAPFRCRKEFTSQNMMAAVSFDFNFLFVCTGWEGSAADMRVLRWACKIGGFVVPEGKYYLVDSGYANTEKFLAPYRGERYNISQFDASTRAHVHRNPRDLYNHRNAQLRNVVEMTFGILKKRFKILNVVTPFSYKVQCLIAMACCIIHNFIRRHQVNDNIFSDKGPDKQDAQNEGGVDDLVGVIEDSQNGEDLHCPIGCDDGATTTISAVELGLFARMIVDGGSEIATSFSHIPNSH
ncbi:putative nuclease HARBI1 [Ananas comosus]|uniref:Putative nuclease HARBI1 n=1 Tax=Ananas comosus TaxID=4615 RepID=A0A199UEC4_ANACO|nr:putative nuclease HARBI1 [Ananas comosus]